MHQTIEFGPSYAMGTIDLAPGESLTVEAGSMIAMSDGMRIRTTIGGNRKGVFGMMFNFFAALIRKLFGGESFFVNTYTPPTGKGGQIRIAPTMPGDIRYYPMDGNRKLILQSTSFLASQGDVIIRTRFGGLKSLFSGQGAFWLVAEGAGDLWFNSYGAIHEIEVHDKFIVDTGHIVAFDETLDYRIRGAGGIKSTLMSGEGLVCEFSGNGKLFIQSRTVDGLVGWITPRLSA